MLVTLTYLCNNKLRFTINIIIVFFIIIFSLALVFFFVFCCTVVPHGLKLFSIFSSVFF